MGKKELELYLSESAYRAVIISCTRFANARIPNVEWREVFGLMLGYIKKNKVVCTECVPMTHIEPENSPIPRVEYQEQDYVQTAIIEDEAACRDPPQFIIGWYHSHPGFKIMFSSDDIKNQLYWQGVNPKAVALVFNPQRLVRQVEVPERKGDPEIPLKNDPGFKVYVLDNPNLGRSAKALEIDYQIFSDDSKKLKLDKSLEQLLVEAQDLIIETTKYLPRTDVLANLADFVTQSQEKLKVELSGIEEYSLTLRRKGEEDRLEEMLQNQRKDIDEFIRSRDESLAKIQEVFPHVEYKERDEILPQIESVIQPWRDLTTTIDDRFKAIREGQIEPK